MMSGRRLTVSKAVQMRTEDFYRYLLTRHFSITPQLEKKFENDLNLITNFLMNTDVPLWYRGKSQFQIDAANNLAYAIRDDCEQGTTHRVRRCLISIGLHPLVKRSKLKLLIDLCKGNDLAFLWFLMELYYKTPMENEYTVNEQLILSTIAHLDMVTTLRELDRILPPGNEARSTTERLRRSEAKAAAKAERERQYEIVENRKQDHEPKRNSGELRKKFEEEKFLPYFQKVGRPSRHNPTQTSEKPPFKVNMSLYSEYLDPNYLPPNEINRWFTNYELNNGSRIVKRIIDDVVDNICNLLERSNKRDSVDESADILEIPEILAITDRKTYCAKHMKKIQEKPQRTASDPKFELRSHEKMLRLQRVLEQLQSSVNAYRLHYGKKMTTRSDWGRFVRILGKDGSFREFLVPDSNYENCVESKGEQTCHTKRSAGANGSQNSDDAHTKKASQASDENVLPQYGIDTGKRASSLSRVRLSLLQRFSKRRVSSVTSEDVGKICTRCLRSSERYFEKPTENKPYQFNYRKIFKYKDENDLKFFIKSECLKALGVDEHEAKTLDDYTPNLLLLAEKCANEIWQTEVEAWREEHPSSEQQVSEYSLKTPYPPGMPILDFYDCEDIKLMTTMLKIALDHMGKNRKFVLASLPECHKLPFLKQWIFQRYGKRYSIQEQNKLMNGTLKIIAALENTGIKVPTPLQRDLGNATKVDYSCREHMLRKAKMLEDLFYERINTAIMEHARITWLALRPYLCSTNKQRLTFFAYMPSRVADTNLFRVWKATDVRDYKGVWEKRRYRESLAQKRP